MKSILLTNQSSLYASVTGGVQLCSQEFLSIIQATQMLDNQLYYVSFTRNIKDRFLIKFGFEMYNMYNIKKDANALLHFIESNNIDIVFINMASLVRYAKPIKKHFGDNVKIVLISHGNHSGDFLHIITKPMQRTNFINSFIKKIRLGILISVESTFRIKYLDSVLVLSETEREIENWFGAKQSLFMPRCIKKEFLPENALLGKFGFVGRLDHPPNFQGIEILLHKLQKEENNFKLTLIGAPESCGKELQNKFPNNVNYLGELSNSDLEKEVSTWSLFLNPVWWYSTGASTKLAKAIGWGIPIITTTAGMRGYQLDKNLILVADTPVEMIIAIKKNTNDQQLIQINYANTKRLANSNMQVEDLANQLQEHVAKL